MPGISTSGTPSEIEQVKGTIINTNKKYREEISKYRDIARFNQQLSTGYIRNLEAMVDVTKTLNYYAEIFNVLRAELQRNDEVLGASKLKLEDITHLENLTRNKIDSLNQGFMSESEKLKRLYGQFGKEAEALRVRKAQENMQVTTEMAERLYGELRPTTSPVLDGGKGRKKKAGVPKKKKTT